MPSLNTTNTLSGGLLRLMAANFNMRPAMRGYLKGADGWMNFTVGFRTRDNSVRQSISFIDGKATVNPDIPEGAETTMIFRDEKTLRDMLRMTPDEVMNLLLENRMALDGNLTTMSKFNYLLSLLLDKNHRRMAARKRVKDASALAAAAKSSPTGNGSGKPKNPLTRTAKLSGEKSGAVLFIDDPYMPQYSLDSFPRLKKFLDIHLTLKPEICHERPLLLTEWFRENGFETDNYGVTWNPTLRQGLAFKHLMENRRPIIRKGDLLAGTTTTKEIGVVLYPDTHGTMIWGELNSAEYRRHFAYTISAETKRALHHDIFPFWEKRNMREWVRDKYNKPLSQLMDERFAVFFLWKTAALSHTIPDFPKLLAIGTEGLIAEINTELKTSSPDDEKKNTLRAMIATLEGLDTYAANLAKQAALDAAAETDPARAAELRELSEICARVPSKPACTLDEAVNALWLGWIAIHMENTNAGFSLGRLDLWLQPYFESGFRKLKTPAEKEAYIKHAIELVGCFYLRCTDHLPLIPDIGNFLFGGSSSDQAITLGGVKPDGTSAVSDMTYIFLKVTEILRIRDPNVNARFHPEVNSASYLRRLCEVNLVTTATPSMHNDIAVMESLAEFNYPIEHLRDWSATGCVEPTISGRHLGHTNCMMMNMVAGLELAMNNGRHPLMDWEIGPRTGDPLSGAFETFEDFFGAFKAQYGFLIDKACEYNNMLGEAHSVLRPTPFLSSIIDGSIKKGRDVTLGGALYNSSGAACIGLADVTDSLMAVKKLVYDEKIISLADLCKAVSENFVGHDTLHARIANRVPKFGSGDAEALEIAGRVTEFSHDYYAKHNNFRGGRYTTGFWSMSNHVAFGCLSGALPSGRLAGKPFTPGLTPSPGASDNLLDPLRDVASLNPRHMDNNIAFNVKVVPSSEDSHERAVDNMFYYVKSYFDMGGMQIQLNVVTSDTLRDAMVNPENYRNLLVRISGYNAYFVTLNRQMQNELIERAEYGV